MIDQNGHTSCAECRAQHKAAWIEEHSRYASDGTRRKDKGWMIGDECMIDGRRLSRPKGWYYAKILDMSDVSRHDDGNYDLVKLEITASVKGLDGKDYEQTWTHPEPVQSYKLRKRY
jgi:hypothetical protein